MKINKRDTSWIYIVIGLTILECLIIWAALSSCSNKNQLDDVNNTFKNESKIPVETVIYLANNSIYICDYC